MKRLALIFFALTAAAFAQPAPYPITINSQAATAPQIQTFRASPITLRVQFMDGATVANLTSLTSNEVFFSWAVSSTSSARVAASARIYNATNGQAEFTLAASNLNYSPGRYLYECGISNAVVRQGVMLLNGSPFGTGASPISFATNVNWNLISWLNLPAYITDAPANASTYGRKSNAWVTIAAATSTNGINIVVNTTNGAGVATLVTNTLFIGTGVVASAGGAGTITNIASSNAGFIAINSPNGPTVYLSPGTNVIDLATYSLATAAMAGEISEAGTWTVSNFLPKATWAAGTGTLWSAISARLASNVWAEAASTTNYALRNVYVPATAALWAAIAGTGAGATSLVAVTVANYVPVTGGVFEAGLNQAWEFTGGNSVGIEPLSNMVFRGGGAGNVRAGSVIIAGGTGFGSDGGGGGDVFLFGGDAVLELTGARPGGSVLIRGGSNSAANGSGYAAVTIVNAVIDGDGVGLMNVNADLLDGLDSLQFLRTNAVVLSGDNLGIKITNANGLIYIGTTNAGNTYLPGNGIAISGLTISLSNESTRLKPILGIGNVATDGGHAAVNDMHTRLDLRSTNYSHAALGLYQMATNLNANWPPALDVWNYGTTVTGNIPANIRSGTINFGVHTAEGTWGPRVYAEWIGTTNTAYNLITAFPDVFGYPLERMRVTPSGIVVSGTVTAASGFTGNGANLTNLPIGTALTNIATGTGLSGALSGNQFFITNTVVDTDTGFTSVKTNGTGNVVTNLTFGGTVVTQQMGTAGGGSETQGISSVLSLGNNALGLGPTNFNGANITNLNAANVVAGSTFPAVNGANLTNLAAVLSSGFTPLDFEGSLNGGVTRRFAPGLDLISTRSAATNELFDVKNHTVSTLVITNTTYVRFPISITGSIPWTVRASQASGTFYFRVRDQAGGEKAVTQTVTAASTSFTTNLSLGTLTVNEGEIVSIISTTNSANLYQSGVRR